MKKKLIAILLASCVLASGCGGNKSKEQLIDIEQFKCQESIQSVFDVLGEVEIQTSSYDEDYCKYENLNLWGYNGTAYFDLRDDKDTISQFYCSMILNEKVFEKIVSCISDKHGSYEVSDFGDTIKTYKWEIEEDKAKELGYSKVHILYNGDKKYTVYFSDEWSGIKDEAYYEHLEDESSEESNMDVLAKKTYNIESDTFDFLFGEQEGEKRLYLYCNIEDKSDAFYTHISLNGIMNSEEENLKVFAEKFNFTYSIIVGDGAVLFRSPDFLVITKDGDGMEVDEYFSTDWMSSDEYHESDYGSKVMDFLTDFIENN